jgi:hypothetical protein
MYIVFFGLYKTSVANSYNMDAIFQNVRMTNFFTQLNFGYISNNYFNTFAKNSCFEGISSIY